jgi:hypothetical protein
MQPIWLVERTVNWQHILNLRVLLREFDTEIELYFKYSMPPELRAKFSKTEVVTVDEEHKLIINKIYAPRSVRSIAGTTRCHVRTIQIRCRKPKH